MNGRLVNIDKRDYELERERLRSSDIKSLMEPQGPRAYYWNVIEAKVEDLSEAERWNNDGEYRKRSMPLMQGNLLHAMMIDGIIGWYESDVTRNVKTKAYQDVLDEAEGKPILNAKEADQIRAWFEGAMRNRTVRAIMEGPRFGEQVVLWDENVEIPAAAGGDETITIPSKLSYDLWTPDARYCIKTTMTATPEQYRKQVHNNKYHVSAAFYERGARQVPELAKVRSPFYHIVIMKEHPHYTYVWPMSRIWINTGHRMVLKALRTLARCKAVERDLPPGSPRIDAWPDWLEENDEAFLVPDVWMIEHDSGQSANDYDPFEEYVK